VTTLGVTASLASIEDAISRLDRTRLLEALRPGLPAAAITAALDDAGLSAVPELEVLYGWRDGTSTDGVTLDDIHLLPGYYLLSLQDAIANYRAFAADPTWTSGWLPILANGGGDFYVVDLSASPGSVRHFRIDEQEHPVEFASLGALLATLAAAYERKVFYVDPRGYLEMDDAVFADLAAALNPDVAWWRQ
jgi:cell wall assembly regulator SMI1